MAGLDARGTVVFGVVVVAAALGIPAAATERYSLALVVHDVGSQRPRDVGSQRPRDVLVARPALGSLGPRARRDLALDRLGLARLLVLRARRILPLPFWLLILCVRRVARARRSVDRHVLGVRRPFVTRSRAGRESGRKASKEVQVSGAASLIVPSSASVVPS